MNLLKHAGLPARLRGPIKGFAEAAKTGDPAARRDLARILAHRSGRDAAHALQGLRAVRTGTPSRAYSGASMPSMSDHQRSSGIAALNQHQRVLRGEGQRFRNYSRHKTESPRREALRPEAPTTAAGVRGKPAGFSLSIPRKALLIGGGVLGAGALAALAYSIHKRKKDEWRDELSNQHDRREG